jgi:flagellar biosynthesis GTPase FlhF
MLRCVRYVIVAAAFAAIMYGDDITIPLDDGSIVIQDASFIRGGLAGTGTMAPVLSFRAVNKTSSPWNVVKLQFYMGGICNGEPRQWSHTVVMGLGWMKEKPLANDYTDTILPLVGEVNGCDTEIIKAELVLAENPKLHIDGVAGEPPNFQKQLREIEQKRKADAAVKAEQERIAAEQERIAAEQERVAAEEYVAKAKQERIAAVEQAKKENAAEEAHQKRVAAERRKKEAEDQARIAKAKAEEQAKAAEERRKIRAACSTIYQNTADKKVSNLTVREEQQVRTCQALDLYPPQ